MTLDLPRNGSEMGFVSGGVRDSLFQRSEGAADLSMPPAFGAHPPLAHPLKGEQADKVHKIASGSLVTNRLRTG